MLKQLLSRIRGVKENQRYVHGDIHQVMIRQFGEDLPLPVGYSVAYDATSGGTIMDQSEVAVAQFSMGFDPLRVGIDSGRVVVVKRFADGDRQFFSRERPSEVADFVLDSGRATLAI